MLYVRIFFSVHRQSPKIEKMAKHLALGHSKLDELLGDAELLARKQVIAANKPKKVSLSALHTSLNASS